jgi:hypothetical protein
MKVIITLIIYLLFLNNVIADTIDVKRNFIVEAKLSFLPKIPIMNIATILTITNKKYKYEFSIRTTNIVEFINKVNGDGVIQGFIDKNYQPSHYIYKYKRNDKKKSVEIKYINSKIEEINLIPAPDKTKLTKVHDYMLVDTIDPSSFFLNILDYKNIEGCDTVFKIFDGKRRYDVVFSKTNKIISDGYIYCEAKQNKLGGYKINEKDDVFAESDYIKIVYKNNDKKDFYGYEAVNDSLKLFISEIK